MQAVIEAIWKNEILFNWSRYWNPIERKFRGIRSAEVIHRKEQ
jgi:hypothetical protein